MCGYLSKLCEDEALNSKIEKAEINYCEVYLYAQK